MLSEGLLTAFLLGFLSSFHCIGMCGPICSILPKSHDSLFSLILKRTVYNWGRILTYMLLGLLMMLFGYSAKLVNLQVVISLLAAILILIFILFPEKYKSVESFAYKIPLIRKILAYFYLVKNKNSFLNNFYFGLINGFLPCGLVYLSLITSSTYSNNLAPYLFMGAFGFGTFPVMLTTASGLSILIKTKSKLFKKVQIALLSVIFVLIVLRTMDLQIPFISPDLDRFSSQSASPGENCH